MEIKWWLSRENYFSGKEQTLAQVMVIENTSHPGPYTDLRKRGCEIKGFYKGGVFLKKIQILRPKFGM